MNQEQNGLNGGNVGSNPTSNSVSNANLNNGVQQPNEMPKPTLDSILNGNLNNQVNPTPTAAPIESLEVEELAVPNVQTEPTPVPTEVVNPVNNTVSTPIVNEAPTIETIAEPAPTPANTVVEAPVIENINEPVKEETVKETQNVEPTPEPIEAPAPQTPPPVTDDFNAVPVPPILDSGEKEKKKGNKKVFIIILLIILIALVGVGVYLFLNTAKQTVSNSSIVTNELKLELGSTLDTDIDTYATIVGYNKNDCNIDLSNVDTSKVSTYKFTVTCGNASQEGLVIVDDSISPEVVTNDLILLPNATVNPEDFILECIDASTCSYEFENSVSTTTLGEQEVSIIVSDSYNNKSTVKVNLTIANNAPARYLTCSKNEETLTDIPATLKDSYKIGVDSTDNFYNAVRITEFKFNDQSEYETVVKSYDENVGINNITGESTFNNSSNKITIKATKTINDLRTELNGNIPTNSNILRAFLSGKGYMCN